MAIEHIIGNTKIVYAELKTFNGRLVPIGCGQVRGSQLECYDWNKDDFVWLLDKTCTCNESSLYDYFVYNESKDSCGWVNDDQIIILQYD